MTLLSHPPLPMPSDSDLFAYRTTSILSSRAWLLVHWTLCELWLRAFISIRLPAFFCKWECYNKAVNSSMTDSRESKVFWLSLRNHSLENIHSMYPVLSSFSILLISPRKYLNQKKRQASRVMLCLVSELEWGLQVSKGKQDGMCSLRPKRQNQGHGQELHRDRFWTE